MKKISKWITEHSKMIVLLSILLCIPAIYGYVNTKVNYDILAYLPEDIETIEGQDILTNDFGIGAFSFVLTDNKSSRELLALEEKIKKIDSVNQVLSIADVTDAVIPITMLPDRILEKVYKDGQTVIVVTFSGGTSEEGTMNAIAELRQVVGDASRVSGMTAMVLDTMNLSSEEMLVYIVLAVIFCAIVLFFATDSFLIPFFLLGNIGFAILYNMGSNLIFGSISYITQAITAVLQLGVTMDFSIFLYHKYEQKKESESDKLKAMALAIDDTFRSVIGSSLTTVAGFLALCFMDLTLGRDIGLVMAKGVICGLLCVLTLFPALLLVFDKYIEKTKHKVILPEFKHLQKRVLKWYIPIIVLSCVIAVPAVIGNHNVEVYYKLDNSLPEDLASRIANSKLANDFNIVSPEIILLNKDLEIYKLEELLSSLKNIDGVSFAFAPGVTESFGIPSSMIPEELVKMMENDRYQLVLVNSSYEVASDELNQQLDTINQLVKSYDEGAIVAGEGALTKDLVTIANHDFLIVNYISIAVIFVIMLFVLKSFSLPIILVVVIEFAIFSNMAFAYFLGVKLPFIASIVVGTIQLGATIDYAILMSNTYLEQKRKTKDKFKAMEKTLSSTVPSIIVSAMCFFAATFGVSVYSKIDMIGSICNLLSRGAVISMIAVCFLLPSLLLVFDKLIMKTTKGS